MNLSDQKLLELLHKEKYDASETTSFNPIQMANLYTKSALLVTIVGFLKEQLWLNEKEDEESGKKTSYEEFITPLFQKELFPILFLKDFLITQGSKDFKTISQNVEVIEDKVLSLILERSFNDQRSFLEESLREMTLYFIQEEKDQEGHLQSSGHQGLCLYRTFDKLDEIFDLNYQLDRDLVVDHSIKERLYEGAGIGVQSGYSTILLALHNIELKKDDKIIDLGSGYGRVGLVCSLMRPDVEFVGYEYVPHRVEVSNNSSEALGLVNNLMFKVQDLSLASFKIPVADVYYFYDPFSKETYEYVLDQIVKISKTKKITIVSKGNSRSWLLDIANENSWPKPITIHDGNLCIFKSSE